MKITQTAVVLYSESEDTYLARDGEGIYMSALATGANTLTWIDLEHSQRAMLVLPTGLPADLRPFEIVTTVERFAI